MSSRGRRTSHVGQIISVGIDTIANGVMAAMQRKQARVVLFLVFSLGSICSGQDKSPAKLILRVDETTTGPFGGEKSSSCLRVYSDGDAAYASWRNSATTVIDKSGQAARPERLASLRRRLEDTDVWELSSFLKSGTVRKLHEYFGPPHRSVDYIESNTVRITLPNGATKRISTREFYVASLEEEARYPSALVVLMRKIDEIERQVNSNGTPADVPADCQLKPAQ